MSSHCYIADPAIRRNGLFYITRVHKSGKRVNETRHRGFTKYNRAAQEAEKRNRKLRLSPEEVDQIVLASIQERGDVIETLES